MDWINRFSAVTLLLLIVLHFTIILKKSLGQKTALLFKRDKWIWSPMKSKAESYRSLVLGNDILIDKSLFIKELLEHPEKRLMISCPPKWSKTVVLDMVKTFLQIETDDMGNRILPTNETFAYRLFKYGELFNGTENVSFKTPFLISQHQDVIDQHLGQYPVVYVCFNNIEGMNDDEAVKSVNSILQQAYTSHKYLAKVLEKIYKSISPNETIKMRKAKVSYHRFKNILEGKETNPNTIKDSLNILCKLLYRRYNKRVIVLVDDYDLPFYQLLYRKYFPEVGIRRVLKQIRELINPILFENSTFVERVVFAGTFGITNILEPKLKTIPDYTMANIPWLEYFGISENEQQQLCNELELSKSKCSHLKEWYLGYKASHDSHLNIGPIFSTAMYLESNASKGKVYLAHKTEYDYIVRMVKIKPLREVLESLASKNIFTIRSNDLRFSTYELRKLKRVTAIESAEYIEESTIDLILSYLCALGYLTFSKPNMTAQTAQVWIPNKAMVTEVCRKLKSYYSKTYNISHFYVDKLVADLNAYVLSDDTLPPFNNTFLNELFAYVRPYRSTRMRNSIDQYYQEAVHSVLSFISMNLRSSWLFKITIWKESNPPVSYMLGTKLTHGVIVAAQYNTTADNLLAWAKKQRSYLQNWQTGKFVAIAFDANETVSVASDCG